MFKHREENISNGRHFQFAHDYLAPMHTKDANIHRLSSHIQRLKQQIKKAQKQLDKLVPIRESIIHTKGHDKSVKLIQQLAMVKEDIAKLQNRIKRDNDLLEKTQVKLTFFIAGRKYPVSLVNPKTARRDKSSQAYDTFVLSVDPGVTPPSNSKRKTNYNDLEDVKRKASELALRHNTVFIVYKYLKHDSEYTRSIYNIASIDTFNGYSEAFKLDCKVLYRMEPSSE